MAKEGVQSNRDDRGAINAHVKQPLEDWTAQRTCCMR